MFNAFNLQEAGYDQVNSYLTMLASRMVYHDAYTSVLNVSENVLIPIAGAAAGAAVGAGIALVTPGGIFVIGVFVVVGAILGGIGGYIAGQTANDSITDRRREEEYISAAGEFFREKGALDVKFISDEGVVIDPLETGFNAVLFRTSNCIVIAVRGTEMDLFDLINKSDMETNLKIGMIQASYIDDDVSAIHEGLNIVLETHLEEIYSIIEEFNSDSDDDDLPIILTGHSLGGATASVLALGVARFGVAMVYSHAGYMPGNKGFGHYCPV